jgi:D-alanine-D-alanine ligase-like ATP-grasp enzyme
MAAKSIPLDYAGVDCLYNSKTGKHIILEVNSGPLLTDESEEFISNYFKKL